MTAFKIKSPHFRSTLEALRLVAPFCMAARFEDGFHHCVEASVCGAEALRRQRIHASAEPCAVVAVGKKNTSLTIGFTRQQLYVHLDQSHGPLPSFDEWASQAKRSSRPAPNEEEPVHSIIRAEFEGETAWIDMTIGQLRQMGAPGADEIPLCLVGSGTEWPSFNVPSWSIHYMASEHTADVLEAARERRDAYSSAGFVEDIDNLLDAALACRLDRRVFETTMLLNQPETVRLANARIAALSRH